MIGLRFGPLRFALTARFFAGLYVARAAFFMARVYAGRDQVLE
jgi:hypothetical protein